MAEDWLTAPVKDGVVEQKTSQTTKKSSGGEMGKDEFLQLLVAQMKYQDPLEPTSNTEYVSQLATFSQLEQMQNLNQTTINTQAFSLVGREVIMKTTSATGAVSYTQGVVEYVTMNGNKTYLSIEGKLYPANELHSVVGEHYIASQKGPKVEATELEYDHDKPKDVTFKISLGEDEYEASQLALFINGEVVDAKYLSYDDKKGEVTVSKDAFKGLDAGTYKIALMFNDVYTTTYTDKVTLKIKGNKPVAEEPKVPDDTENPDDVEGANGSSDAKEPGDGDDEETS